MTRPPRGRSSRSFLAAILILVLTLSLGLTTLGVRDALAGAAEVVVCSPDLARSRGARRDVTLVPNAVDATHLRRARQRPVDLPEGPTAVYVGSNNLNETFNGSFVDSYSNNSPASRAAAASSARSCGS